MKFLSWVYVLPESFYTLVLVNQTPGPLGHVIVMDSSCPAPSPPMSVTKLHPHDTRDQYSINKPSTCPSSCYHTVCLYMTSSTSVSGVRQGLCVSLWYYSCACYAQGSRCFQSVRVSVCPHRN